MWLLWRRRAAGRESGRNWLHTVTSAQSISHVCSFHCFITKSKTSAQTSWNGLTLRMSPRCLKNIAIRNYIIVTQKLTTDSTTSGKGIGEVTLILIPFTQFLHAVAIYYVYSIFAHSQHKTLNCNKKKEKERNEGEKNKERDRERESWE
eukprot:Rmarinus@m.25645